MSVPDSISACAFAASASGNVCAITTLSLPCANSGHTFSRNACASATLRAVGLARSVEPVTVEPLHHDARACRARPRCLAGTRSATGARRSRASAGCVLHVVAADHVEHDVDALLAGDAPDLGGPVLRLVVDRVIGAHRAAERDLVVGSCRRVHRRAERLAELDRGEPDAAGAAVDQHRFAGVEANALEEVVPDGEVGLGHACRFAHRQARRQRQAEARRRGAVLGVAAAGRQRAHLVADAPVGRRLRPAPRCARRLRDRGSATHRRAADTRRRVAGNRAG